MSAFICLRNALTCVSSLLTRERPRATTLTHTAAACTLPHARRSDCYWNSNRFTGRRSSEHHRVSGLVQRFGERRAAMTVDVAAALATRPFDLKLALMSL